MDKTEASLPNPDIHQDSRGFRRRLLGVVVSDKMNKTVVVSVTRRVLNKKFGKYETMRARYKAHNEDNSVKTGDRVLIVESRPLSREKRWRVLQLVEKARQA